MDMEIGVCKAMVLAIPTLAGLVGLFFLTYKGWTALWEKYHLDKLRAKLDKYIAPLFVCGVLGVLVWGVVANVHFIDCGKSDSVSRAMGVKEPVHVAGLPCACGCGKHK